MTHDTNDSWNLKRIADALERLAPEPFNPPPGPVGVTMTPAELYGHKSAGQSKHIDVDMLALAGKLIEWHADANESDVIAVLRDAIMQATKAETIEWLAAIAKRYGFEP